MKTMGDEERKGLTGYQQKKTERRKKQGSHRRKEGGGGTHGAGENVVSKVGKKKGRGLKKGQSYSWNLHRSAEFEKKRED